MKTLLTFLCIFTVITITPVMANTEKETLSGEWHGEIQSKQGNTTFIFKFNTTDSGKRAGTVNIAGAKGNGLPIENFEMKDGNVKISFNSGKAEYQGTLSGNQITGNLITRGVTVPLTMEKGKFENPYALSLTTEEMKRLNGEWHGVLKYPAGPMLFIIRFGQNGAGEYVGLVDRPYYSDYNAPITEAVLDGDKLEFKVPNINIAVRGTLAENSIRAYVTNKTLRFNPYVGTFPITLERGHQEIPDLSCNLPKDAVKKLLGTWTGYIDPPGSRMENIFHVERRADGKIYCYHDNPTMGFYGSIMINKSWDDGRMNFQTIFPTNTDFKAHLSGNTISGSWHPQGVTVPAHYEKSE